MLIRTREKVPLSVLIIPTIAIPLQNVMQTHIAQLPHLQGLSLAHPVTKPATIFEISLLIGADHYWDIVEDHIIRGNGPTAMNSKIGYLLSGPLSPQQTSALNILNVTTQYIDTRISSMWQRTPGRPESNLILLKATLPLRPLLSLFEGEWAGGCRFIVAISTEQHF